MVRSWSCGATTCDRSGHNRMCQVKEKRLRKENITMWSVGHMGGLWCGTSDIPRMQQRSVEIGDLSVNPMWFWGVRFWSSEMVSWHSIKECKMEVRYGAIRRRVSGVQDRAKVQRCKDAKMERSKMMRQSELKSEFWGKTSFFFRVDTKVLNTNDK